MSDNEKALTREWIERWQKVGPLLEEINLASVEQQSLSEIIPRFNTAFRMALKNNPPRTTSGLVEQQAIFQRWRS